MLNSDMGMTDVIITEEELMEQKILAQKKEKKIKVIRLFSVFAYLVSVSLVAGMLSAYYICIWNPRVTNNTISSPTINAERIVMALQRTSDEFAFTNNADSQRYSDNENILSEVLHSSKSSDHTESPEESIKTQTSTFRTSTEVKV